MNTWKKRFCLLLLSSLCLFNTPVFADNGGCNCCCDTWDLCDWSFYRGCCWEMDLDYLYWKACVNDLDYAGVRTTSGTLKKAKFKSLCPDWESGVRIRFMRPFCWCDWGISLSYTYMDSEDSERVCEVGAISAPPVHQAITAEMSLFDEARGDWELCYHEGDLLLHYDICCSDCHRFVPYFGVAGIYVDQDFEVDYFKGEDCLCTFEWESDYWGVGFRLGNEYQYRYSQCLGFFVNGSCSILAGEADDHNISDEVGICKIEIDDDRCCRCVTGCHIGAGLLWEACICNYDFALRFGYEFLSWHGLPRHRDWTGDDAELEITHSSSHSRNLCFHGLFAGVSLCF